MVFRPFLLCLGISLTFLAQASFADSVDSILTIRYDLDCPSNVIAVPGYVQSKGKQNRFLLPVSHDHQEIMITGETGAYRVMTSARQLGCVFKSYREELRPLSEFALAQNEPYFQQALAHLPFVVVRSDQVKDDANDVPVALGYSTEVKTVNGEELLTLTYTLILSDEDVGRSVAKQMTRYGRHTDVEWVYRITFKAATMEVVDEKYQSGIAFGIGHQTRNFSGSYLNGTHPLLYNDSRIKHNVFRQWAPQSGRGGETIGHQLIPQLLQTPDAREWIEMNSDWISAYSDQEALREKKLPHSELDYLYIFYRGKLKGEFTWVWKHGDGKSEEQVRAPGSFDRLGEDLFGQEAFAAIYFPQVEQERYFSGRESSSSETTDQWSTRRKAFHRQPDFSPERLSFYVKRRVGGKTQLVDVTAEFQCVLSADHHHLTCKHR